MTRLRRRIGRTALGAMLAGALVLAGTGIASAAESPAAPPPAVAAAEPAPAPVVDEPTAPAVPASAEGAVVQPAAVPIIAVIVAAIVKFGIKHAVSVFGKQAVKDAAKKAVLGLNANKWTHIMAPKHNWSKLGAQGNKDKIADLVGDAMANGTHSAYGTSGAAMQSVWTTNGQTIVVTYSTSTGAISNAWVR